MARIAVIGAGMVGLPFAAAMRNSRHEVSVYEQENKLTELGASISLWANGTRLFDEIGITFQMAERPCKTEAAYCAMKTAAWQPARGGRVIIGTEMSTAIPIMALSEPIFRPLCWMSLAAKLSSSVNN